MSEYFKAGDEFGKIILGMFDKMLLDEDAKAKISGLNTIVVYEYNDPDVTVWLDFREGKTDSGMGDPPGEFGIKVKSSADNGHKLWSDKMSGVMAMAMRKIKVEGAMGALLKLQPLIKKFAAAYNETLKEMGREDIILS